MGNAALERVHAKLKTIRERTDLSLRATKYLRDTFTLYGVETPLKIRYYQVQGIMHLVAMKRFVLGDDTGLGKCVAGDTVLLTDRGLVPIAELAPKPPGQLVPGEFYQPAQPVRVWTGARWAPVKRFYYDGLRPTKKVRTRAGLEVEGSHRHPLRVRTSQGEEWRRVPDIRIGDHVLVDRQAPGWPSDPAILFTETFHRNAHSYRVPDRLTPELARLLGYVVAEGHSPSRYSLSVTQHDQEAHADIRRLFKSVFGWEGNRNNKRRDISVDVSSVQIRGFLETCGIGPALSADKQVPPLVLQGSRASVVEFLRGFFEGEGHAIEGSGVEVSSASHRLLREVHLLLLRLGIVSVLKPKRVKNRDHTYWRLTIFGDDARLFAEHVGFVTTRKRQALQTVLEKRANPNHDVVPFARPMVEALRAEIYARCGRHGYKGEGITKRWGSAFYNTLSHVRAGRRDPTYAFLNKMLRAGAEVGVPDNHPAMCAVRKVCAQHAFYDPVVSVEDGFTEVMDIEVDDSEHCFVGNGLVNHNTLMTIAALCFVWEKKPNTKVIVLTTKSATDQWAGEFDKFTTGINVFVCKGTAKKRAKVRDEFTAATGPCVLVMGYRSAVQDFTALQKWKGYIFVADEATAFKNPSTQVHQVCKHLADPERCQRAWALTATLIKNNLIEGFGIYKVIVPALFGSKSAFMRDYCLTRLQPIQGGRQIPVIVGYRDRDIFRFKTLIDPFFLSRPKHRVAKELPVLTTKRLYVGMTKPQENKYMEALTGLLEIGRGDDAEERETTKLTALIYCQQIVNHLELIECDGKSEKLDALLDLLVDGDLAGEKVIIFSRFRKMVDLLMPALRKKKIGATRITGAETKEGVRKAAQDAFQDPESDTDVICITTAATEAVNLQAAKAIIFYDSPWSAGDLLQALGRMIRIGSVHDRVYAFHMVARGTIDEKVLGVLDKKMQLIEKVMGKRLKGEEELDDSEEVILTDSDINELFEAMVKDAQEKLN